MEGVPDALCHLPDALLRLVLRCAGARTAVCACAPCSRALAAVALDPSALGGVAPSVVGGGVLSRGRVDVAVPPLPPPAAVCAALAVSTPRHIDWDEV